MNKLSKAGVLIVAFMLLGVINFAVWQYEQTLAKGETILLELAPVDPRSLMQGDYMALNFALAQEIQQELRPSKDRQPLVRLAVVELNDQGVAKLVSLDSQQPLLANQYYIQYRERNRRIHLGTNAFFFQEGTAEQYESAKYGLFKVNTQGEMLLTRMLDENFQALGSNRLLQD